MAVYYVALTGDDGTGDGSAGAPWRTIGHALSQCIASDAVQVLDFGPYVEHDLDAFTAGYLTISGREQPLGNGRFSRTVIDATGAASFGIKLGEEATIEKFEIRNAGQNPPTTPGVTFEAATSNHVVRCVDVVDSAGIVVGPGGAIERCLIERGVGFFGGAGSLAIACVAIDSDYDAATGGHFDDGEPFVGFDVVEHCSVLRSPLSPYYVTDADTVHNCAAWLDDTSAPNGFAAAAEGRNSYVFGAETAFSGPDWSGEFEADPLYASTTRGAEDLRPIETSPLIGAGVAPTYATIDYAGNAFATPPSIGAFEFQCVTWSVASPDLTHVVATFDAEVDPTTVDGISDWTIAPAGSSAAVVVTGVTVAADGLSATLAVHPGLTPGGTYTVGCPDGDGVTGDPVWPSTETLDVPAAFVPDVADEHLLGLLEAITHALGQEAQLLSGGLVTRLVADLDTTEVVALVETTLGFPASGAVYLGGLRLTYTGIASGALTGLASDEPRIVAIARGAPVRLDVSATVLPPAGG